MVRALVVVTGLLAAGAGLSACADYPPGYYGPPPPGVAYDVHVRRCLRRHPGYDPRSNTFPGPDGYPRVCRA